MLINIIVLHYRNNELSNSDGFGWPCIILTIKPFKMDNIHTEQTSEELHTTRTGTNLIGIWECRVHSGEKLSHRLGNVRNGKYFVAGMERAVPGYNGVFKDFKQNAISLPK